MEHLGPLAGEEERDMGGAEGGTAVLPGEPCAQAWPAGNALPEGKSCNVGEKARGETDLIST